MPQGHAENATSGDAAAQPVVVESPRGVPINVATTETHWTSQGTGDAVAILKEKRNDTGVAQGNVHSTTGVASAQGQGAELRTCFCSSHWIGKCASDVVATLWEKRNDTGVAQGNVHSTTGIASAQVEELSFGLVSVPLTSPSVMAGLWV